MSATTPTTSPAPPRAWLPQRGRRRGTRLQRRQARFAWVLLAPALAVVGFVAIYPLGQTIYQSFTNEQFLAGLEPTKWIGLGNYRDLIHDTVFRDSVDRKSTRLNSSHIT